MFFNKKPKYKNNFLAIAVPSTIEKYYQSNEFVIYDELKELYEQKGVITEQDQSVAIKRFRRKIATTLLEALKKEYEDAANEAAEILRTLEASNYENMQEIGPKISCVYITIAQCIIGNDSDEVKIGEVASALIDQLESMETGIINTSINILKEDGLLNN